MKNELNALIIDNLVAAYNTKCHVNNKSIQCIKKGSTMSIEDPWRNYIWKILNYFIDVVHHKSLKFIIMVKSYHIDIHEMHTRSKHPRI